MSFLSKFMPWKCTPVLPTVYDDSLSYMELLCKLTKSIDNLSEHISTLESTLIDEITSITQKLDTAILYTEQSLTEEQQEQARTNIGASVIRSLTLDGVTLGDGTSASENYAETRIALDADQTAEFKVALSSGDAVNLTVNFVESFMDAQITDGVTLPARLPLTLSAADVSAWFSADVNWATALYGANRYYTVVAAYEEGADGASVTISGQLIEDPSAVAGAVRFDVAQDLNDTQKAQARENIGASVVRTLTLDGVSLGDGTSTEKVATTTVTIDAAQRAEFDAAFASGDPVILNINFVNSLLNASISEGNTMPVYLPLTLNYSKGVVATFFTNTFAAQFDGASRYWTIAARYQRAGDGANITVSGQLIDNTTASVSVQTTLTTATATEVK